MHSEMIKRLLYSEISIPKCYAAGRSEDSDKNRQKPTKTDKEELRGRAQSQRVYQIRLKVGQLLGLAVKKGP
jgi:hypothetical protein